MSLYLTSDLTVDMLMELIGGNADFEVSDFYNRVDANRSEKSLDPDIVIVNIDEVTERGDIAALIDDVAEAGAKVIGVDILFNGLKDEAGDSMLTAVAERHRDRIVAAVELDDAYGELPSLSGNLLYGRLPENMFGVVNLVSDRPRGVIRSFIPFYATSQGEVPSFGAAVASRFSPGINCQGAVDGDERHLFYSAEEYFCIEPGDVAAAADELRDKIVLLGTINDRADLHVTPVDDNYPGVMIHAHIISAMLAGRYVSVAGDVLNWMLAIAVAFGMCVAYVRLADNNAQNLLLRVLLLVVVAAGVLAGCVLYSRWHICLDVAKILLLVAFSQFVLDVWYASEVALQRYARRFLKRRGVKKSVASVLLMLGAVSGAVAADSYTVYDIKGEVTLLPSGDICRKGESLAGDQRLGLARNRSFALLEKSTRKVYRTTSRDNATVNSIVGESKSRSRNISRRIYDEVSENIRRARSKDMASVGASVRFDGDVNANTEYIYTLLCSAVGGGLAVGACDVSPVAHPLEDGTWWSIKNTGNRPLFVNLLCVPDGGVPVLVYDCDTEMRSLLVDGGSELEMSSELFDTSDCRFYLVASEDNFDSTDINNFFLSGEVPLAFSDFPEHSACYIVEAPSPK